VGGIQTHRRIGVRGLQGFEHFVPRDMQAFGEFGDGGGPALEVGQLAGRVAEFESQLLELSGRPDEPPRVPQVPLDLAMINGVA